MLVYAANIALILVAAVFLLWDKPTRTKRAIFCALASLQWILLSGLRHVSVGADTLAYKVWSFDLLRDTPWSEVLRSLQGWFTGQSAVKDPGYSVLVKSVQFLSVDYQVFLIFIAVLFTVPLGVFIFRYSAEPCASFLVYSCLFAGFFAVTGIRQTVATALVVLVGYKFIKERRLLPFLLLTMIAFTIHKSSLVFLPFYFLAQKKITGGYVTAVIGLAAGVAVYRNQLMRLLGALSGYEQYAQQWAGAGTAVFTAMLVAVAAVALWRAPAVIGGDEDARIWYNALFGALVLVPLTYVDPSAMRVVMYYSLFLLLLVPAVITSFTDARERVLVYYVAASALLVLFARVVPKYLFFWQGSL